MLVPAMSTQAVQIINYIKKRTCRKEPSMFLTSMYPKYIALHNYVCYLASRRYSSMIVRLTTNFQCSPSVQPLFVCLSHITFLDIIPLLHENFLMHAHQIFLITCSNIMQMNFKNKSQSKTKYKLFLLYIPHFVCLTVQI